MKTITIWYKGTPFAVNELCAKENNIENGYQARNEDDLEFILDLDLKYVARFILYAAQVTNRHHFINN